MEMFKKMQRLRDENAPLSEIQKIYDQMNDEERSLDRDMALDKGEDHHRYAFVELLSAYISALFPEGTPIYELFPGELHTPTHVFDRYQYGAYNLKRIQGKDEKMVAEWVSAANEMFIALFEAVSEDPEPT